MKVLPLLLFAFFIQPFTLWSNDTIPTGLTSIKVQSPAYVIGEQFAEIRLEALKSNSLKDSSVNGKEEILINGEAKIIDFIDGIAFFAVEITENRNYSIEIPENGKKFTFRIRYLPPWLSIFPPLIAIILALLTKEVIISLFISIFFGVLTLKGFEIGNIIPSLFTVVDRYILETLKDTKHLSVILFSFLIGGMVAVISQSGGMRGIAARLQKYAHSPRSSQLMTFFLSFGIFYDNYANTLIVGNTMRPVTDRYKVSREKLAFIVHSTAASLTAIAFISTWIGAELGYINDATSNLGIPEKTYGLFLKSLQYSFYPVLMLFFIFFLILLKKDFGPMGLAEVETRNAGVIKGNRDKEKRENEDIREDLKLLESEIKGSSSWLTAFIPLLAFITAAFTGLIITGSRNAYDNLLLFHIHMPEYSFAAVWDKLSVLQEDNKRTFLAKTGVLISYSDFYIPLLWSSFTGVTVAILLTVVKKENTIRSTMENLVHGFRIMLSAVIILVFAWALAAIIKDLHTTEYIASIISSKLLFPRMLPPFVFILSALFSFATGSVWGTMAILYPLIVPVSWSISMHAGLSPDQSLQILYMIIASIIGGSVFGNHSSPISDTTIVSSISSNCDHVAHVKTQVPYALTVAGTSLLLLFFALAGIHWSVNYLTGIVLLFLIVKYKGKILE